MVSRPAAIALSAALLLGWGGVHAEGWLETRIAIEEFTVNGDYESAFALGDQYLAEINAEFGATSTELADAHLLLASLYRGQTNFPDAELHYLKALEVLEARDGAQSVTLVEPLVTLGETYFAAGEHQLALSSFDEARAIGRRSFGLLNVEQIEIIDRITVVYLAMGNFDEARDLQRAAVDLVQRASGERSVEYIDAQFRLARWYMRYNRLEDARRVFLDINNLIRNEFADDPLLSVRLLRSTATALRNADPRARSGRTNPVELEKALRIVEELEEPQPLLQAEILRDIGDWNVALSIPEDIAQPYADAWAVLDSVENGSQSQREWFSPLTLLSAPQFQSPAFSNDPDAPWGRIEIEFIVDSRGRASNVRVLQSDPPGLIDSSAIRQIMRSRFRPRMDNGRVVASQAVIGWDYQYNPAFVERASANRPAGPPPAP